MKAFILTLVASLAIPTIALPSQRSFEHANQLAADGKWTEAIASYQESLNTTGPTAAALYNLGNAHYAAGDRGRAILAWERAKLAAPGDADIANNLALARRDTGTTEPEPSAWQMPAFWLSVNGWAIASSLALAVVAAVTLCGGFGVILRGRRGLCLTATSIAILSVAAICLRANESDRAIVIASNAPLRISPFDEARQLSTLPPGSTVDLLRKHDTFNQVMTSDGTKGWVKETEIEMP